jgi:hypothetical protein
MESSCDSVADSRVATEVDLLWSEQSPRTSMAGTLGSTTNSSLRKVRRARNRIRRSLVRRLKRLGHRVTLEPLAQIA